MKRLFAILLCLVLVLALPITARADTGPKPSVTITIKGLPEGVTCYGTLLSKNESTGPSTAYDGTNDYYYGPESGKWVWEVFVDYQDTDGFYYLQEHWDCSDGEFRWGYYPPSTFKVLLYFPEEETFVVSGILERYAFDSYFTVDLTTLETGSATAEAAKSYDFTWELISLLARIVITIAVELAVALLFGYRKKHQLVFLGIINVVTQVMLNVALNYVNYSSGQFAFVFWYVVLELAVFTVEAIVCWDWLPRHSDKPMRRGIVVLYVLAANAASFAAGLWLAHIIPGIF